MEQYLQFKVEKAGHRNQLLFGSIVGIAVGATTVAVGRFGVAPPYVVGAIAGAIAVMLMIALSRILAERRVGALEKLIEETPEIDEYRLFKKLARLSWMVPIKSPITHIPKLFVKRGIIGKTYELWVKARPSFVEPLAVSFEPRLLDEADRAFDELATAAQSAGNADDCESAHTQHAREELLDLRVVKRNIKLKGGWIVIICFMIPIVVQTMLSIQSGRLTWELMFWLAMLALICFGPTRTGLLKSTQWLLVPGGVVCRKAGWRDKKATLHLFDRRKSVMCISTLRRNLLVTVSDGQASESTWMTGKERDLMMRAWMSPLSPPPVEQLSDIS